MKQTFLALLLVFAAMLSGCLMVSLHPFYSKGDIIEDSQLVGIWQEDGKDIIWLFQQDEDKKTYAITITEGDGLTGLFIGTPFKINNELFVDIYPGTQNDDALKMTDAYKLHRIPAHSLIHVKKSNRSSILRVPSFPWFTEHLESHPKALKHEIIDDNFPVLTATTKELQAFWFKHLETEDAYIETKLVKQP
ncbi:MAG: hypothetical protein ABF322_01265 [Lentimonas sp.]